ncbi:MAG: hypothetical protein IT423_12845, partial [Pirellulaceae bacterium]|nr:hypothetical protein [Pirellulaceae bacterium]
PDYASSWAPADSQRDDDDDDDDDREGDAWSYVPIDPCQPVIMALRLALGEHLPIEFIDLETNVYQPQSVIMPDPFALKTVSIERFATAVLPSIMRPFNEQTRQRLSYMGHRLWELEKRYQRIVVVCSIQEWPWLRESYQQWAQEYGTQSTADSPSANQPSSAKPNTGKLNTGKPNKKPWPWTKSSTDEPEDNRPGNSAGNTLSLPEHDSVEPPTTYAVSPSSLVFLFGELPYITGVYERARRELEEDDNLSIDGVKQLLMSARSSYLQDLGKRARRITPLLLRQCLKYIRNLTLMDRRLTPDLYTITIAAQQILGDQYAIHLIETARDYPFEEDLGLQSLTLGIDQARLPSEEIVSIVSRLPGPPLIWRSLELQRRPVKQEQERWKTRWNPYSQCSWPPEDTLIESFRTRVVERARAIIGADLARSEKFTTSIKDGIDIRETIRHWYDGDIYVKVMPPSVGTIDCCVMLFETPADPAAYPWRTTWFAEHHEESTLAFFATDFRDQFVGPGIAQATYGGSMFLFPPVSIPDIWEDPRLEFTKGLEERLVAAACLHARERQIALLSPQPPNATFRQIAKRFRRSLVHIPLGQFNDALVQQLRMVHVLNGREVRSFAAHFIRKA